MTQPPDTPYTVHLEPCVSSIQVAVGPFPRRPIYMHQMFMRKGNHGGQPTLYTPLGAFTVAQAVEFIAVFYSAVAQRCAGRHSLQPGAFCYYSCDQVDPSNVDESQVTTDIRIDDANVTISPSAFPDFEWKMNVLNAVTFALRMADELLEDAT